MIRHGVSAYRHGLCRCEVCRAANTATCQQALAARRAGRVEIGGRLVAVRADQHGTVSTYRNWGCRCEPCSSAQGIAMRAYKQARKAARS